MNKFRKQEPTNVGKALGRGTSALPNTLLLCSVALLTGCAATPTFETHTLAPSRSAPIQSLYVYSFLDIREHFLGTKVLVEFERQLDATFSAHGIKSKQLWSMRSPTMSEVSLAEPTPSKNPFRTKKTSVKVPVGQVVSANKTNEQQFGAQYRLMIFPSDVLAGGVGPRFRIQWQLIDTREEVVVWAGLSRHQYYNAFGPNEMVNERAKGMVDELLTEWIRIGLLESATVPNASLESR